MKKVGIQKLKAEIEAVEKSDFAENTEFWFHDAIADLDVINRTTAHFEDKDILEVELSALTQAKSALLIRLAALALLSEESLSDTL